MKTTKTNTTKAQDAQIKEALGGRRIDRVNWKTLARIYYAARPDSPVRKAINRIGIAIKLRTTPAKADDVAETVEAVEKADLTKGVEVPMPAGRRAAKGRDGAAPAPFRPASLTKDATAAAGRAVGQRGGTGAKGKTAKAGGKMPGLDGVEQGERTLTQIGLALGVTKERVRQIEAAALARLRKLFGRGILEELAGA